MSDIHIHIGADNNQHAQLMAAMMAHYQILARTADRNNGKAKSIKKKSVNSPGHIGPTDKTGVPYVTPTIAPYSG